MAVTDYAYDYGILGAGIAGLSLADALQELGNSVCVVEKDAVASGASGTPLGMINPATGRRATKTWRAEACYAAVTDNLEKVTPYSDTTFYSVNGVLRPALTAKIARKMREQFDKTGWPDGWCHWLTEREIKQRHPGITCIDGGLWIPVGITVDIAGYLRALAAYLEDREISVITGNGDYEHVQQAARWEIRLEDRTVNCSRLVFATGYGTVGHSLVERAAPPPHQGPDRRIRAQRRAGIRPLRIQPRIYRPSARGPLCTGEYLRARFRKPGAGRVW